MPNACVSSPVFSCVSYRSISFSEPTSSNRRGRACNNLAFFGWKCRQGISARAVDAIEKESAMAEKPGTFLRDSEGEQLGTSSVRARFEKMIRKAQDDVCATVEAVDGHSFREDVWSRPGGGAGISRVLHFGNVWEKAGVNVSVVYGSMPPEAYRAAKPVNSPDNGNRLSAIPFFASSSPYIPKRSLLLATVDILRHFCIDIWFCAAFS